MAKGGCRVVKIGASVALLAALAAVLVLATGCGGGEEEPSPSPTPVATSTPSPTPSSPFEGPVGIDLNTSGTSFAQGKPIQLAITVTVRDAMTLYYRTSQRYDLVVINAQGQEVWRWSRARAFAQVTAEVPLGANETLSFTETWDQRDNSGQQVSPGDYEIVAESSHCDANYANCGQLTTSVSIQIGPSQGEQ